LTLSLEEERNTDVLSLTLDVTEGQDGQRHHHEFGKLGDPAERKIKNIPHDHAIDDHHHHGQDDEDIHPEGQSFQRDKCALARV